MRRVVRARALATSRMVTASLVLDLALVFALTVVTTTPEHYARALFGTIVIVHVANFFYGRVQAWRVVEVGIIAYLLLIASAAARIFLSETAPAKQFQLFQPIGGVSASVSPALIRRLRDVSPCAFFACNVTA